MTEQREAGPGEVFVCGCCGRTARRVEDFREHSCQTWAELCYEASIERDERGQVVRASVVRAAP